MEGSSKEFRVIIPVRYNSVRLPGKPLLDIAGKPMLEHVYERAVQSGAVSVAIATDDKRIAKIAQDFGATVCMTSSEHTSGTDRIAEAVVALGYEDDDIVVNVQGDMPLIPPGPIRQVAENLARHDNAKTATLCEKIETAAELWNSDIVKVVVNKRSYALYFSRAPIAWDRKSFPLDKKQPLTTDHYRHRGLYAYRVSFLADYTSWDPSPLEEIEKLEQLRNLWYGTRIHVALACEKIPPDVNTQEDLERVRKMFD